MACITKLANAIAYDCDSGATGLVSALIINKADIASFTVDAGTFLVSALTLNPGATAFKIDTVKRSLVVSSALKVNDGAPNAFSHSATIVYTGAPNTAWRYTMNAFTNGSFVVITAPSITSARMVYGLYYGLSATSSDMNSHDNGSWNTTVLSTPENVIGEDTLVMSDTLYQSLYAAAVG
jgi:hypothetical protein